MGKEMGMRIAAVLAAKGADVVCVGPEETIAGIVKALVGRQIGAVLVTSGDSVLGVLSERDVVWALADGCGDLLSRTAREMMTSPVITISPDDSVVSAMRLMTDRRVRHLPVLESGRLAGLVSIGDLVKARIELAEREALELKDYIATA